MWSKKKECRSKLYYQNIPLVDFCNFRTNFFLIFNEYKMYLEGCQNIKIQNRNVLLGIISVQSLSCVQLCDSMDFSKPGFLVYHQLPELTQTHVHWVGDAIQPSHPLSSPSPPAFSHSQHQGLFQWVSSSHQVAKLLRVSISAPVLPTNILGWFPLAWTGWVSLLSKGVSRVFSNTTVQKHQFFGIQLSL